MTIKNWLLSSTLVTSLALISSCAVNPVSGKKDFVLMSESQEVSMGAQLHQQALKEYPPYNNAALQAYVNQIGQQLARNSHRNNIPYHFTVVDDPSVNAFALPGGYVYIARGLLAYLNSEAELAGVLGHEIGHVTARHSVRQQSRETVTGLLARVLTDQYGNAQLFNTVALASVRGFGRDYELEADRLGAEYLARDGYNPERMIDVVEVLKSQEDFSTFLAKSEGKQPPSYHGTFSTHPSNDKRLQSVIKAANSIHSAGTRGDNVRDYMNRLEGLSYNISDKKKGRIHIITARPGDTFESLARNSPIEKYPSQKLRLLNGMYPNGQPSPGQLIKIVR